MRQKGAAPILIVILIALAVGGYFIYTNYSKNITKAPTSTSFDVIVKENNTDKNKSDIYLKDKKSGQEILFTTITDVYRGHYHNAEFKNGNLYIIRRTGGDSGYENNPNWTDELWKYDSSKQGTKLYSNRGLDFRVSNDDKLVAIIGTESERVDILAFIDTNGKHLAEFGGDDLGVSLMQPLVWGENSFWVVDLVVPYPEAFIRIDIDPFKANKFDVEKVGIRMEYVINPDTEKVAYSDYPPLFDVDSAKEYEQSGKKVTLTVYDLVSKQKRIIDTSITKKFNPKWVDNNTLEYDNPSGEGRVQSSTKLQ